MKSFITYMACFAASLTYWELLLKGLTGNITDGGFYFLCFIPVEALLFTFFEGWLKEIFNRIFLPLLLFLIAIYYSVQVGYYTSFGSLLSVSLLSMGGDAISEFGWSLKSIVTASLGEIILIFLPVLIVLVLSVCNVLPQKPYSVYIHICAFFLIPTAFFLGIVALLPGGTSRQSAYYAFSNSLLDTDSSSQKIGASFTTLLETGSYLFGFGHGQSIEVLSLDPCIPPMINNPGNPPAVSVPVFPDDQAPETEFADDSTETFTPPAIPEKMDSADIDFAALSQLSDDDNVKALCNYFSNIKPSGPNEMTGIFAGYNLIYICAESFWTYAVNETATPTLYKLANHGIVLQNYYNSYKNTTTNGEFAFLTALWPDISRDAMMGKNVGSLPQSSEKYMPYGLGNISSPLGYHAYGYHNYKGSYYSRNQSLPNLGLTCKFMNAGMTFTSSWPSSDLEMMQQSVDDYLGNEPFIAYYMTFSGHGPYDDSNYICKRNLKETEELTAGMGYSNQAVGYLSCYREFDKAMEYLLNRLEEAGVADRTLIVIAGDHYPYYVSASARNSLAGHKVDEVFEMYKSTCILYNAGIAEPIYCDACCCNVDILPTVFNLLDIPYDSRMLAGTDIFSEGIHKAVLYNKSFITDTVKYNASNGNCEWLTNVSSYSEEELDHYVETISQMIDAEYAASLQMMDCDFYRFVWGDLSLIPKAEN